jgi:signal peptidase I
MTTENPASEPKPIPDQASAAKPEKKEDSFPVFLIKLFLIVIVFRSFILSPFNIPSESMLPRLQKGDYLLASKWSYGYSKYSLPFSAPLIPGRLFASQPERGDVAIFKAPPANDTDYIKRVIGLPGDQIQMLGGVLQINGQPVPKVKVADAEYEVSPYNQCNEMYRATRSDGTAICRYPRFKETLPNGVSYYVLDMGTYAADDTPVFVGPEGHLFMMGDNRDNSQDSRFWGFVPDENLVGKAFFIWFNFGDLKRIGSFH